MWMRRGGFPPLVYAHFCILIDGKIKFEKANLL
jgi:hypothetical protein